MTSRTTHSQFFEWVGIFFTFFVLGCICFYAFQYVMFKMIHSVSLGNSRKEMNNGFSSRTSKTLETNFIIKEENEETSQL